MAKRKMSDRVAICCGQIVTRTPRDHQTDPADQDLRAVKLNAAAAWRMAFPAVVKVYPGRIRLYFSSDPGLTVHTLLDYLSRQGDKLIDLRVERPSSKIPGNYQPRKVQ
jgi:hypothetical protein